MSGRASGKRPKKKQPPLNRYVKTPQVNFQRNIFCVNPAAGVECGG